MNERAVKWQPVADIDQGFGSISFAYEPCKGRSLSLLMHGDRTLSLRFTQLIALRYEDECPGFDPLPTQLPMLKPRVTFPLIRIEESEWAKRWAMHKNLVHFALISSDDLIQLIAKPEIEARWI